MAASSSSQTDEPAKETPSPSSREEGTSFEKWLVRIFLVVAFGVAFGIEGMTLLRSYVLERDTESPQAAATAPVLPMIAVGDDLLPEAPPTERIEALTMEARRGDTWTFRMVVALQNSTEQPYELATFGVLTRSGRVYEEAFQVACPPGDSARLVAEWNLPSSDPPESLVASGRLQVAPDSAVAFARRVQLPRIPVQMER